SLSDRITLSLRQEHANPPHALLLPPPRSRPPERCGAREEREEIAAGGGYSMTSSARPSSGSGNVMPSVFAALRLMINSTLLDCWTGRSAGLSPFSNRP